MKTTTTLFQKLLIFSVLCVAFMSASSLKAQSCTYVVQNDLTCPIIVQVAWTDCTNAPCGSFSLAIGAGPGTTQPYICTCSGSTPICNITVTLQDINGTSITSGNVVDNIAPLNSGTTLACGGITYNLSWAAGITIIN
jgi:hypothetical protein